jgi:small subunit ribosomal protein S15
MPAMLTKTVKGRIIKEHRVNDKDTGSAAVQIAVLSRQIDELTKHLKKNAKDNHSRRGLLKMVSQRRKLLAYMADKEPKEYEKLIKKLGLKK